MTYLKMVDRWGDIMQGVTLEVFGEGESAGPLNDAMKEEYDPEDRPTWTTLREFLDLLEEKGISTNVASFIGATTVRVHELGYEDRAPTPEELERMKALVRDAMEQGALGLGSSLIYAPAFYADTEELIELSNVVSEYDGMYISHMRSEGNQLLEALEELITIAREADVKAEVYHLKAAGESNWHKMDQAIARIEEVRAEGLAVTADMYTYVAGATGLDAHMPPWVQEGGFGQWRERLMDPNTRAQVLEEMRTPTNEWEKPRTRRRTRWHYGGQFSPGLSSLLDWSYARGNCRRKGHDARRCGDRPCHIRFYSCGNRLFSHVGRKCSQTDRFAVDGL